MKIILAKIEGDKRALQEELSRTENRSTKLELQRMSAEGDLQRLQMMLHEKDDTIQVHMKTISRKKMNTLIRFMNFIICFQKIQEKCEHQSRTIASLEERCVSLKSTIDQMNISLEKASQNESDLKLEMQSLQRNLMDASSSTHSNTEKLKQVSFLHYQIKIDKNNFLF